MSVQQLLRIAIILLILVLIIVILYYGKNFLVPVTFAGLLAMLLLPIAKWLKAKGINKSVSILLSMLVLISFFAVVFAFAAWQVADLAENASNIEQKVTSGFQKAKEYVSEQLGIPEEKQQQMLKQQQTSGTPGKLAKAVAGFVGGFGVFLGKTLLVLVYIFLFMYFRGHIRRFIIQQVAPAQKENASATIDEAQKVIQKYLVGMALMIAALWVMYGVGFTIAGVKNAIFFAILCGLLEIVPFIGNLTGALLTLLMTVIQGGGTNVVIGIIITYGVVQFVQTYLLEPLVVGKEVDINPLFTVIGLIGAELVWGIAGMVVIIPLTGVARIIFDHVPSLKPFAELIGEGEKESGTKKKVKQWFRSVKPGGND